MEVALDIYTKHIHYKKLFSDMSHPARSKALLWMVGQMHRGKSSHQNISFYFSALLAEHLNSMWKAKERVEKSKTFEIEGEVHQKDQKKRDQ